MGSLLHMTVKNGGKTSHIIFDKLEVQVTSETCSRVIQIGIKEKIANSNKIDNSRFIRIRSVLQLVEETLCVLSLSVGYPNF